MTVTIKIELPSYLRDWLIATHGGETPVRFRKGSAFASLLRVFIRNKRERENDEPSGEGTVEIVEIVVPKFPGKDPAYHNYLPRNARVNLQDLIRDAFDVALYSELKSFLNIGRRLNDIVYSWMEDNGIELTDRNYESVMKRVKILRSREKDRIRKKEVYHKMRSASVEKS